MHLLENFVSLLALQELFIDLSDYLAQLNLVKPLGEAFGLNDLHVRLLRCNILLVLEHVALDMMPVLKLLLLQHFIFASQLDLHPLLLADCLLYLGEGNAEAILFGKDVQKVTFLLLHLQFELANLVLLLLHFLTQLFKGVRVGIVLVVRILNA